MECQPENGINIKPFEGEECDRELYKLYPFLQKLNDVSKLESPILKKKLDDRSQMSVPFKSILMIIYDQA